MKQAKAAKQMETAHRQMPTEQRRTPRIPTSFGLLYSAIHGDDVIMGDGTVIDLSKNGLGIRGNTPVKKGIELTLFLYLPDGDDPLFVLQARVAYINGRRFGVEFLRLSHQEGTRLQTFLATRQAA